MGNCNNLILHCMDYRLQNAINEWIESQGFGGDIDRIAFGGPCRNRDIALEFIKICCDKHGVKNVFLSQHDDCAGYGGHDTYPSLTEERDQLLTDMAELKRQVEALYPDVKVTTLHMQEDGDDWKIVEVNQD